MYFYLSLHVGSRVLSLAVSPHAYHGSDEHLAAAACWAKSRLFIRKKKMIVCKIDLYHHVSFPDALPSRQVFGNKDTDGFYRAEIRDRVGLIPCNMVSEIQTEDDDMMDQLLDQGFLPLNTPVEKLGRTSYSFCCLANCLSSVLYWNFSFSSTSCLFLVLPRQVNFDRLKDGRSLNRRSRKSKRGVCPLRCSSAFAFHLTIIFFFPR